MKPNPKFLTLSSLLALILWSGCAEETSPVQGPRLPAPQLKGMSYEQYGIPLKGLRVQQGRFEKGEYLRDVLEGNGIERIQVDKVTEASEGVFDFTRIRAGNPYTLLRKKDGTLAHFVYDITESSYVVIDFVPEIKVSTGEKTVEIQWQSVGIEIETNLYEAIDQQGLDVRLVGMLEQAFGWAVDFSDLEVGDEMAIIYERPVVEGSMGDISGIVAAQIQHKALTRTAIFYQQDSLGAYYLPSGRNLKPGFMSIPLASDKPDEISLEAGRFQAKMIGPAHTPVVAMGDGKVTRAIYTQREGFHVYMDHGMYRSQYTHLDSLNPDLKARGWYLQGDTLGWLPAPGEKPAQLKLYKGRRVQQIGDGLPLPGPDISPAEMKLFSRHASHVLSQLDRVRPGGKPRSIPLQP